METNLEEREKIVRETLERTLKVCYEWKTWRRVYAYI